MAMAARLFHEIRGKVGGATSIVVYILFDRMLSSPNLTLQGPPVVEQLTPAPAILAKSYQFYNRHTSDTITEKNGPSKQIKQSRYFNSLISWLLFVFRVIVMD